MKNIKWFAFLIIAIATVWSCTQRVVKMKANEVENRAVIVEADWNKADSILALMTLPEKLGQLQQLDGGISKNDLPRLIEAGKVGSVLNEVNPELI